MSHHFRSLLFQGYLIDKDYSYRQDKWFAYIIYFVMQILQMKFGLLSWKRLVNRNTFCVTSKIVENKKEVTFDGELSLSHFQKYP